MGLDRRIVDHRRAVPGAPQHVPAGGEHQPPAGIGSGGEIERRSHPALMGIAGVRSESTR